jgi:hypothetical protein
MDTKLRIVVAVTLVDEASHLHDRNHLSSALCVQVP